MKQIKFLVCAFVLAFGVTTQAATVKKERLMREPQAFINTNSKWQAPAYLQMENGVPQMRNVNRKVASLGVPSDTILTSSFGFLQGPDGEDWLYTQEIEVWTREGVLFSSDIKTSTITFYDAKQRQQGKISFSYDESRSVNALEPYGIITKNFFDTDEKTYEVLIYEHEAGNEENNYTGTHKTYAYRISGEKLKEYDAQNAAIFSVKINDWTSEDYFLVLKEDVYGDCTVDVYGKEGWGGQQLKHTFRVPYDNIINHVGPYMNTYEIQGKPYFTFSYYEKPFYTGEWDENWQMIETSDNSFIIDVYDGNFVKVDSVKIPVEKSDDYSNMYGFGFLTYNDLSKGLYSNDSTFNFLITLDAYDYLTDNDYFTFAVYNNKGEKIKTIDENVDAAGILMLDDVEGHETQWAFGHTDLEGTTSIRLVNIPSCEVVHEITPSSEVPVTFELNRYAKGDGYQYISTVNTADLDDEENVIARVGWYNQDFSLDHFVRFNLGKNGIYCTPCLFQVVLNPYLFNTDDAHEYVYLSQVAREVGSGTDTWLTVTDNNGDAMLSYKGNPKRDLVSAGFLNGATTDATMYIVYVDENGEYMVEFVKLPFTKFAGGEGTKEKPYIVNTFGDLQQIASEPAAHYIQGRSIDMGQYSQLWKPIDGFAGTYDGQNYSLENMSIAAPQSYYIGLFGEAEAGAHISNLHIKKPTIKVYNNNQFVGVLLGGAMTDTITNVHVYDATIQVADEGVEPIVGGLVGTAAVYTTISSCSFNNGTINIPAAYNGVGGIVGDARTNTFINACAASGAFTADSYVGGILGSQGNGTEVKDCHANVNLKAKNTIGGLVGANTASLMQGTRGLIQHCLVEGTIEATEASVLGGLSVGGVVGSLSEDWNASDTKIIEGNVVTISQVTIPADATDDQTVHGIAGYTIQNAEDQPATPYVEKGLANNYISKAFLEGDTVVGDTTVNGALKELTAMNKEFFTSLGFAYGETVAAPWVDGTLPFLYIEEEAPVFVLGVTLNISETRLFVGTTEQLTATINPAEATNKNLVWATSDEKIATVDENGLVKAVAKGTAIITVTTEEGGHSATCNIIVYDDTAVENVDANSQVSVRKVIENGTLYIIRTAAEGVEERFMIDGRKVK